MATLKNRKWYDTHMMRRAGKPQHVFRLPLSAIKIENGLAEYVGTTHSFITWRDGRGVNKEFARLCAGIEPRRLYLLAAGKDAAVQYADNLNASIDSVRPKVRHIALTGFCPGGVDVSYAHLPPIGRINVFRKYEP